MKELDVVIHNVTGLHARPAKVFVNAAKQFESDIRVQHNGKKVNAKSLIAMLALGVKHGGKIRILTDGSDEEDALHTLVQMVESGLGEEDHVAPKQESKAVEANVEPRKTQSTVSQQESQADEAKKEPTPVNGADSKKLPKNVIQATAAAPGIAIGQILKFEQSSQDIVNNFTSVKDETKRLDEVRKLAESEIQDLYQGMVDRDAGEEAEIFKAHLEILNDADLLTDVQTAIGNQQGAAYAWQQAIQERAAMLAALDDPLLAARAADVRDVGDRVLRLLTNQQRDEAVLGSLETPVILLAHDLTPSQTAELNPDYILGLATVAGGPTAHAAIIARALSLPAVVNGGDKLSALKSGTEIILDGIAGTVTVKPSKTALKKAKAKQKALAKAKAEALAAAANKAVTQDGRRIEVAANIGGVPEAQQAYEASAEGVGLMRTEFLFLGRTEPPSEDEQFTVYRDIVSALSGEPVIFRTLDIGGDKPLPYIETEPEDNPFLGERGIRLCLNRPELLKQQLRALLRAASFGPLRIMFPMVGNVAEWRAARAMVTEIQAELGAPDVEVGIMVEVPSAAIMADAFANEVDFFSVGTNDLTQYTLAIDRMHPTMSAQSDGLHPAVLRLIQMTTQAAHAAGKWVGVCGELGSDPAAVPILVGLGVDELSVNVPSIASTKALIRTLSYEQSQLVAKQAIACATAQEVRQLTTA